MIIHATVEGQNTYRSRVSRGRLAKMQAGRARKSANGTLVIDSKKQRVYNAEGVIPLGKSLPAQADMQSYVNALLNEAWFRRRWGRVSITVQDGRGCSSSFGRGGYGRITISKDGRYEHIVLHEIAHCLTPTEGISRRLIHGASFARILLELVGHVYGVETGRTFRAELRKGRVSIGPALKLLAKPPAAVVPVKKRVFRVKLTTRVGKVRQTVEKSYDVADIRNVLRDLAFQSSNVVRLEVWEGRAPTQKQVEAKSKAKVTAARKVKREAGKVRLVTLDGGYQAEIGQAGPMGVAQSAQFKRDRSYGHWIARCPVHGEWSNYEYADSAEDAAWGRNHCGQCHTEYALKEQAACRPTSSSN